MNSDQTDPMGLSNLIWFQTVCKGYQQTTMIAVSKEKVKHACSCRESMEVEGGQSKIQSSSQVMHHACLQRLSEGRVKSNFT